MTPEIHLLHSKAKPPADYKVWHALQRWVARDKVRNTEIADEVFRKLKEGHKCVAVPVDTKLHMRTLAEMINERCEDEGFEPGLAVKLEANSRNRKEIIRQADQTTKPLVVVPISSIFKDGLDLRALSWVIRPVPSKAVEGIGAPMFRQGATRCATPAKGKKQPGITLIMDHLTMTTNQMRRLFWFELVPGSKTKQYKIPDDVFKTLSKIPRWLPKDYFKGARSKGKAMSMPDGVELDGLWGRRRR